MLNPIAALLIEILEIYKWIVLAAVIVSWLTAFNFFGPAVETRPYETLEDVFRAVERGDAGFAVVPVENSLEGSISKTYDLLLESLAGSHPFDDVVVMLDGVVEVCGDDDGIALRFGRLVAVDDAGQPLYQYAQHAANGAAE